MAVASAEQTIDCPDICRELVMFLSAFVGRQKLTAVTVVSFVFAVMMLGKTCFGVL